MFFCVIKYFKMLISPPQLTSHTAFERSDNTEPGAVTSLAVSRDHRWAEYYHSIICRENV